MDSTKDLLINRAIQISIDVGMLKVTATTNCNYTNDCKRYESYFEFVFFFYQNLNKKL